MRRIHSHFSFTEPNFCKSCCKLNTIITICFHSTHTAPKTRLIPFENLLHLKTFSERAAKIQIYICVEHIIDHKGSFNLSILFFGLWDNRNKSTISRNTRLAKDGSKRQKLIHKSYPNINVTIKSSAFLCCDICASMKPPVTRIPPSPFQPLMLLVSAR